MRQTRWSSKGFRLRLTSAVQQGNFGQNEADLGGGKYDGELELGIGAGQFHFVGPGTVESFLPEELDGADGLGAGLTGNFLAGLKVNAVLANVFGGEQLRGLVVELADLSKACEIGLFGAETNGQELEVVGEGF